jgi:hypothetical protein
MSETLDVSEALSQFTWERQPNAQTFVRMYVDQFLDNCPAARKLADRMERETGTRFVDWVDYIQFWSFPAQGALFDNSGYAPKPEWAFEGVTCHHHPGGVFPLVSFATNPGDPMAQDPDRPCFEVAIKVDSVTDFAAANGIFAVADAPPLSPVRRLVVSSTWEARFVVVERHGYRGLNPPSVSDDHRVRMLQELERFRCRPRQFATDDEGFDFAERLVDHAVEQVGRDAACDLFFAAEREFWQRRNRAAQFQKARQDRLGLGWANHDHHTYRSSRRHFPRLIRIWEKLGFELRERFYAGAEAGWGAQVAEQPNTGIVTFNDVDLSPEELMEDFSHNPLPERKELGTVGLWCALHGESFLGAGMHHLECQFDFDSLKRQMEAEGGIKVMKPFTDFPYLRQAFTEGERWAVDPARLDRLVQNGQITAEQAEKFREQGAIGSHLENLERNEGFKGFNQKGVSEIIARVDPRKH